MGFESSLGFFQEWRGDKVAGLLFLAHEQTSDCSVTLCFADSISQHSVVLLAYLGHGCR